MSQNKERIQILSDARRGDLQIPDAITRLQELSARHETPKTSLGQARLNRELRILRTNLKNGKVLMDIRLPVGLLEAAERVGARLEPLLRHIPADRLKEAMANPGTHLLVNTILSDQDEHLEIYLD